MNSKTPQSIPSSGNVFADLGLPNASELQVKARVAAQILASAHVLGWTQKRTADAPALKQSEIVGLKRGQLWKFSLDRLIEIRAWLHQDLAYRELGDA